MKPLLVFDYDGTIHKTLGIYEPAMRRAFEWLRKDHGADVPEVSSEQIAGWLGMSTRAMWQSFLPDLPETLQREAGNRVGDDMAAQVRAGKAVWYDGVPELLDRLKADGFRMIIISRCKISQRESHWQAFHMERWFDRYYDSESFSDAPKSVILRQIRGGCPDPCIVIGDRDADQEAALGCGVPFIGCRYGYHVAGELEQADCYADRPAEIYDAVRKLTEMPANADGQIKRTQKDRA